MSVVWNSYIQQTAFCLMYLIFFSTLRCTAVPYITKNEQLNFSEYNFPFCITGRDEYKI